MTYKQAKALLKTASLKIEHWYHLKKQKNKKTKDNFKNSKVNPQIKISLPVSNSNSLFESSCLITVDSKRIANHEIYCKTISNHTLRNIYKN